MLIKLYTTQVNTPKTRYFAGVYGRKKTYLHIETFSFVTRIQGTATDAAGTYPIDYVSVPAKLKCKTRNLIIKNIQK